MNKALLLVLSALLFFSLAIAQDSDLLMDMAPSQQINEIAIVDNGQVNQQFKEMLGQAPRTAQGEYYTDEPTISLRGVNGPAYGLDALGDDFIKFWLNAPTTTTVMGTNTMNLYCGDFDDVGVFYAIDNATSNLVTIDTSNGAATIIGTVTVQSGHTWTGMSWDVSTSTMYASSTDGTVSALYTLDLTTPSATLIGTNSTITLLIDIAFDPSSGQLYGHDLVGDGLISNIYLIDKTNVTETLLGATGFDALYAQGMDFNPETGELYLAAYNNSLSAAELRLVNLTNGNAALIGSIGAGSGVEVCAFAIVGTAGDSLDPKPPENLTAYSDYSTPTGMELNWTDPTEYVGGTPLTNFQIIIARDAVVIDSVAMGTETFTDAGLTDGQLYAYDIWAKDNNDSTSSSVSAAWTAGGAGQPMPPTAFSITNAGGGMLRAHWVNPTDNIDGTPMDDLDEINLYENGTLLATYTVSSADTGMADSADFTPTNPNLEYYVTAVDNETPAFESDPSNSAYPPFSAPYFQDFEAGGALPVQWTNETDDDFDWDVHSGTTGSSSTGPSGDHTTGSGYYMYTEASSPNYPSKIAHLTTPFIDFSGVSQPGMSFWYHMYGSTMGELHVDVYANGMWNLDAMNPLIGQQQTSETDPYLQAVVDLSPYAGAPIQVRFRGITGTSYYSDMAIDDVLFGSLAGNPQMVVTPLTISDTLLVGGSSMHNVTVENQAIAPTTLNYTVTEDPSVTWLSVTPTSGSITSGNSEVLDVTLDATSLTAGSYNVDLIVAGNDTSNFEDTVAVTLVVNEAPDIDVVPDTFDVTVSSGNTLDTTMTIYNNGAGPLNFDVAVGGALPEIIYYKFDEAGASQTQNFAAPGSPAPGTASVLGLTMGGTGYDGAALIGNGGASSTNYVDTGWITNLGTGSWTISLWMNNVDNSTTLYYTFGDNTATSFRAFTGGVAGAGNIILRGPVADVLVTGVSPGPSIVDFVYDDAASEVRAYLNGVLVNTVAQSGVNVVGTSPFKVGGYSTSTGMNAGMLLDEFKIYNRAIDLAEGGRGTQAFWLVANPTTGTVQPGDSAIIDLTFDPTGLLGGDYETEIVINSNDPVDPEVSVGVHMFVHALANVGFNPEPVVFDTTFVNETKDMSAYVLNPGAGVLNVTSIISSNSVFSVNPTTFDVPPLDSVEVTVSFAPTTQGTETGTITINSNAANDPSYDVSVSGVAVPEPIASVDPGMLTMHMMDSTDAVINITNTGGSNLIWSASTSWEPVTAAKRALRMIGPAATPPNPANTDFDDMATPQGTPPSGQIEGFGDMLMQLNLPPITGATSHLGCAFAEGHFWVTSSEAGSPPNWLHKIDEAGNLVQSYSQPTSGWGWRDLVYDGTFLYGSVSSVIEQIDPATGTPTGTQIPGPMNPNRALAYDPATDHFWVSGFSNQTNFGLHEIDRAGNVINTFPLNATESNYGAAWDTYYDTSKPYIWLNTGTSTGDTHVMRQVDPLTAQLTGLFITGVTGNIAGGLDMTTEMSLYPNLAVMVAIGQTDILSVWEIAEAGVPWLTMSPTSGTIQPQDVGSINVRAYMDFVNPDTAYIVLNTNAPSTPLINVMVTRDTIFTGIKDPFEIPTSYAVSNNYPNPFNPTTTINYQLPQLSDVKLVIYNVLGQKVRTLINKQVEAGYHSVVWDGHNDFGNQVATGLYIYRFEAANYSKTMKMMLLK